MLCVRAAEEDLAVSRQADGLGVAKRLARTECGISAVKLVANANE